MNELTRLAARREQLIAQAAAQRMALAQSIEPWRAPLALADQGLVVVRLIKSRPAWLVGAAALFLAVLRPAGLRSGHIGKWLRRGWVTWQIVQNLSRK
ncbi:MAG: YqjK-like family protein [Rugosibacter sp.]|nr:YqjK-like family protein [Rugosibacter sp.]